MPVFIVACKQLGPSHPGPADLVAGAMVRAPGACVVQAPTQWDGSHLGAPAIGYRSVLVASPNRGSVGKSRGSTGMPKIDPLFNQQVSTDHRLKGQLCFSSTS